MNTLLYAAKAQVISNIPIVNEDPKMKKMRELQMHVKYLSSQLNMANNAINFFKKVSNNGEKVPDFDINNQLPPELKIDAPPEGNDNQFGTADKLSKKDKKLLSVNSNLKNKEYADIESEVSANFYSNQ